MGYKKLRGDKMGERIENRETKDKKKKKRGKEMELNIQHQHSTPVKSIIKILYVETKINYTA